MFGSKESGGNFRCIECNSCYVAFSYSFVDRSVSFFLIQNERTYPHHQINGVVQSLAYLIMLFQQRYMKDIMYLAVLWQLQTISYCVFCKIWNTSCQFVEKRIGQGWCLNLHSVSFILFYALLKFSCNSFEISFLVLIVQLTASTVLVLKSRPLY